MMTLTMHEQQKYIRMPSFSLLMILVMFVMLNGCGGGLKLTSDWQQGKMNIDGTDTEWQRGLYYDNESDMLYGVRNDDQYVYIFLKTQNRSTQKQIMRQGLTVWFDRENGKNQTFGIKYPMSRQETHAGFSPDSSEEKLHTFLDQEFPELEIIGPKKEDIQRFSTLESPGIRIKLGRTREALVYELCVPLKKTAEHPFAIEPISAHSIGIEFETGEITPGQNKGGMHVGDGHIQGQGLDEGNSTEEGSSRRYHGGGNHSGYSGSTEKTDRMELWLSVQLAKSVSQ
jgi:hypothetical protein